jgi:hypothetical protein
MREQGTERVGHSLDGAPPALDDRPPSSIIPSHSRVWKVLCWLRELLLLASLAIVCSCSFDMANGRTPDQLEDIIGMLHVSAIWICVAIVIGMYVSVFYRPFRSSTLPLPCSPSLASCTAQCHSNVATFDSGVTNCSDKPDHRHAAVSKMFSDCPPVAGRGLLDDSSSDATGPRDAPSSYSPSFVSQLRGQLVNVQHQLSLEKTAHIDNVALLREQLQSLQARLSTLQGWRMKELTDEQVESIAEEVRDAMRMFTRAQSLTRTRARRIVALCPRTHILLLILCFHRLFS